MYKKYLSMHLKSSFEYRTNLFYVAVSQMLVTMAEIISVYLLFAQFDSVGEWGFYETALMFGIINMCYSLVECFARGYDSFAKLVKSGDFDRMLVRPVNIHLQIFSSKIELFKLGRACLGLTIIIIALVNLNVQWTIAKLLVLIMAIVCGIFINLGNLFIGAGISIFTVENLEFLNIITNGGKELSYYPINIYNKWLSRFFTFVIPLACFNYLPISYIMGYGDLPRFIYAISPILGCLYFIPCFLFFNWSLKKYQGTGT